jgi:RNA-directed DNA polymerase
MDKKTRERHQHQKAVFCGLSSIRALCGLLQTDQRRIRLLAQKPPYKSFSVPKKEGGERHIEAPGEELKRILGRLNQYLQSIYFFEKSSASYGFILGVQNDDDRRNVLTNARKHAGRPYLLNVDMKDFFHFVTREQVLQIFLGEPFRFKGELPDLLADLTTYQGRLPMGAPTSPVLSNFACRELDAELIALSENMLWVYTRYADDMSFSAKLPFNSEKIASVRALIRKAGFEVNERKVNMFGPDEEKIVTGLLVTDTVTLAPDFLPRLSDDIGHLQQIMKAQNEQGQLHTKWVEQFKKQIIGRINFAGFVLKKNNEQYIQLKDAYYTAINPPEEEYGAVNWRAFPYNG